MHCINGTLQKHFEPRIYNRWNSGFRRDYVWIYEDLQKVKTKVLSYFNEKISKNSNSTAGYIPDSDSYTHVYISE